MVDKQIVLVTGVANYWGSRVAAGLAIEPRYHVIGLDLERPTDEIRGLDFVQADIRNPLLPELFASEGVDKVCHLAFVETTRPSEAAFGLNVMGTAKLLGACAEAGVRKVVIKSSTAVYGARPSNSAFLAEDHALRGSRRTGTIRDLVEIEKFCSGFRHQEPAVLLTILRFPGIVGPTADTPMTRFLGEPAAPTLLGFDPLMQLIHEDDVVAALIHAVASDVAGVFNVAAEDVLTLNRIRGLAGKMPVSVFHPLAYWGSGLLGRAGLQVDRYVPIELDYLRYPWVADLTRMHQELGFAPQYTAEESVREFAEGRRARTYEPDSISVARDEERLRATIEQRRQAREQKAGTATSEEGGVQDE
jgi:UDP-glucose 4-epimerase